MLRKAIYKNNLVGVISLGIAYAVTMSSTVHAGWTCLEIKHTTVNASFFNNPIQNKAALGLLLLAIGGLVTILATWLLRILLVRNTKNWLDKLLVISGTIIVTPIVFISSAMLAFSAFTIIKNLFRDGYVINDVGGTLLSDCTVWTVHTPLYVRIFSFLIVLIVGVLIVRFMKKQDALYRLNIVNRPKPTAGDWKKSF